MLTTYIIGCLALIVKPGPDLMCTLATALAEGKAKAATLMTGLILGCWLWVVLLTAGVSSFFTAHRGVMVSIQLVGVCYIAYLACMALRDAVRGVGAAHAEALDPASASGWRLVGRGVFMSMSNPLTILFFLAFLPGFTRAGSSPSPALQTLLLGTLFCALVPFVYLPVILAADFFRARLLGSARAGAFLKLLSGLMLAAVVVLLLASLKP